MGFIIDFLSGIASVFTAIFDFIGWIVNELIEVVGLAVGAITNCLFYVGQLPVVFLAPFMAIITIALIFKIKG